MMIVCASIDEMEYYVEMCITHFTCFVECLMYTIARCCRRIHLFDQLLFSVGKSHISINFVKQLYKEVFLWSCVRKWDFGRDLFWYYYCTSFKSTEYTSINSGLGHIILSMPQNVLNCDSYPVFSVFLSQVSSLEDWKP